MLIRVHDKDGQGGVEFYTPKEFAEKSLGSKGISPFSLGYSPELSVNELQNRVSTLEKALLNVMPFINWLPANPEAIEKDIHEALGFDPYEGLR